MIGNTTIGVGALSYAGQFNLTIVAENDACPDLDILVEGLRAGLNCLTASSKATGGSASDS